MTQPTEILYANSTDLPDDLAEAISMQVVADTKQAVAACVHRNEDFDTYDLQLRRDPDWAGVPEQYEGASTYEDPTITLLQFTDQMASQDPITHREQLVSYGATHPRDTLAASTLEAYSNSLVIKSDMHDDFYDLRHFSMRHSYAWYRAQWVEKYKTVSREELVHKPTGHVIPDDALPEDANAEDYELRTHDDEEIEHEGFEFTVHSARDVYLDPPECQSAKSAVRVIIRHDYTEHDLYRGVDEFEWDEDAIENICTGSPVVDEGSDITQKNMDDGIEPAAPGIYLCFEVIGYPPTSVPVDSMDEYGKSKKIDHTKQYRWFFEASSGIVFAFTEWKSKTCGMVAFGYFNEPGRLRGESVCSMVSMQQIEASHSGRMQMNFLDMEIDPPTWMPQTVYDLLENFRPYPGARFPYPTNVGFNPQMAAVVPINPNGASAAMQNRVELRTGTGMIFSSHARGAVKSNQISATEQAAAGAGADAKSNLFFASFRRGLKELFADVIPTLLRENAKDNQEFFADGKLLTLEPAMLEKRFTISILGDSESANPQIRLQKATEQYKFAGIAPTLQEAKKRGDLTGSYAIEAEVWRALGIRDLKSVMGDEPGPPPDPAHALSMILTMVQQYVMKGDDPNMQTLMQQIQQMLKSSQPQPQQMQGQPQQGMIPDGQSVPFGPQSMNGTGRPPMMMGAGQ